MKTLNLNFEDKDFKKLENAKEQQSKIQIELGEKKLSWERFMLLMCTC